MDILNTISNTVTGALSNDDSTVTPATTPASRVTRIVTGTIQGYKEDGPKGALSELGKHVTEVIVPAEILTAGATAGTFGFLWGIPKALKSWSSFTAATKEIIHGQIPTAVQTAGTAISAAYLAIRESIQSEHSFGEMRANVFGKVRAAIAGDTVETVTVGQRLLRIGDFSKKMALLTSFLGVTEDAFAYSKGKKELNMDNWAGTATDAVANFDLLKGLSTSVSWVTLGKVKMNLDTYKIMNVALGKIGFTDGKYESVAAERQETRDLYERADKSFQPTIIDADTHKAAMNDYHYLAAMSLQLKKFLPEGKIDGKDVVTEFRQIDMTKPENLNKYKLALDKAMVEQQKIIAENSSRMPEWLSLQDSLREWKERGNKGDPVSTHDMAASQLNLLSATEKEWQDYNWHLRNHSNGNLQNPNTQTPQPGNMEPQIVQPMNFVSDPVIVKPLTSPVAGNKTIRGQVVSG